MLMPLCDLRDSDPFGFVQVRWVFLYHVCVVLCAQCGIVVVHVLLICGNEHNSYTHANMSLQQNWERGGYSDDLIVAATCGQHDLSILCPSFAVFPQR